MIPFSSPWVCRLSAAVLILSAAGLHWAYLINDCPLDLAPDEAHYWDWARRPDWSYYSKGPLVAWLIRASSWLTGQAACMPDVRLPAIFCGGLLLASLYVLTALVFRMEALALLVVAGALTLPPVWAASILMTIDAPYTCLWGWALVLAFLAAVRGRRWPWVPLGVVVGLGILAKYTMLVFMPSLALFLLTSAEHRRQLIRPGFWLAVSVASLCCVPILIWNLQHQWSSFRHIQQLAVEEGSRWQPLGPLTYLCQQLALLLGFWFLVWFGAMWRSRPWREEDAGKRFLWWLSAPMFGLFLLLSVSTGGGEINWPVTAYLSGLVLGAGWLLNRVTERRGLWLTGAMATSVLGMAGVLLMHFSASAYPVLATLAGPATSAKPLPLRRLDPTCRLRGWRALATEVDRVREQLRASGIEPELAGSTWWLPGELAFYCQGQPLVHCFGQLAGGRASQYDLWRPNPLHEPEPYIGRTFILVGDVPPALANAFDQVERLPPVVHVVRDQPVTAWPLSIARGFRGVKPVAVERW